MIQFENEQKNNNLLIIFCNDKCNPHKNESRYFN